ncbi:MAG TPA: hypothetical protein VIW92_05920, partial [Thermoanaerobaculia bacterium]
MATIMIRDLSAADVSRYFDDGYLILEGLFSREEVAGMAEATERLRAVGRELAATFPDGEDGAAEQKV